MISQSDLEKLSQSNKVADFLKIWIAAHFPKSSLETLSRKCKISSKSTLHDVLSGRRQPSLALMESLCSGLKIKGPEKKLFIALGSKTAKSTEELKKIRQKVREKNSKVHSTSLPLIEGWDYVYASLGAPETGANLKEIMKRCGLEKPKCEEILKNLVDLKLADIDQATQSYKPMGLHSVFEQYSFDEKQYLLTKLKNIQQKLPQKFGHKDKAMYRHYFFSIPKGSFSELRERLKNLLDEYADESESATGEELSEMFLSFELKES